MIFLKKEPKVLAQEVASDIKRAIVNGMIKPGEKINETQIARDMGISRSPVREALQMLKKEGVVVSIPYKGTFVNLLGKKDIEKDVEKKQLKELVSKDIEFHRNICIFSGNKKLIDIWEGFQTQIEVLINLESGFYERFQLLAVEHRELLSLIIEGKVKQAQEKIKAHILQALDFLKESLKKY